MIGPKRALTILSMAITMVLLTNGTAFAHSVYQEVYTWYSKDKTFCLRHRSQISLESVTGTDSHWRTYSRVMAWTRTENIPLGACDQLAATPWVRPAGYLRVRPQLWVWGPAGWGICRDHEIVTNTTAVERLEHAHYYDKVVVGADCSLYSWYGTMSLGQVYYNGAWRPSESKGAAWLWSGCHKADDHEGYASCGG